MCWQAGGLAVGFISLYDVVKSNESRQRIFGQPCLCAKCWPRIQDEVHARCAQAMLSPGFLCQPLCKKRLEHVTTSSSWSQKLDFPFHPETGCSSWDFLPCPWVCSGRQAWLRYPISRVYFLGKECQESKWFLLIWWASVSHRSKTLQFLRRISRSGGFSHLEIFHLFGVKVKVYR